MPRARGDKEYILPTKGLNSEANLLHFPMEFSPDLNNMEIDFNPQMVRPRKGISSSGLARLVSTVSQGQHDIAITSFLWEGVAGDPDLNFIAIQVADYLYLFDVSLIDDPNQAVHADRYGLTLSLAPTSYGTTALLKKSRIVMTNVKGKLMITSNEINPTIITWNPITALMEPIVLELTIRDMLGIEDGLRIDEHPATLSDDHKYNLYNQGWYKQRRDTASSSTEIDPIVKYEAINSPDFPSNADIVWIGMVEEEGDLIFDPEWLKDQTFGSSPAARGHYVVAAFHIDRATILAAPLESGAYSGGSSGSFNPVGGLVVGPVPLP